MAASKEEKKTNQALKKELATRRRAFGVYQGVNQLLVNYNEAMAKLGITVADLKRLADEDAHISACVSSRKAGVLSLEWEIARGKAKSRESKIIERVFKSLDLHSIMSRMLDAPLYGYIPMEVVWEEKDGLILPADIKDRDPEWFSYDTDDNLRFHSIDSPFLGEEIPPRKIVVVRCNPTYSNPYGDKALARCWWPVKFKKTGWTWWAVKAEKYGMPYLLGTVPQNTSDEAIGQMLANLGRAVQDAAMVVREGQKVETVQAIGNGGTESYPDLIREANADISKAILGHGSAADSTPGKLGNESMTADVRADIVDGDRRMVERAFNEVVRWIHELNFTGVEAPQFTLFEEEQVDKTLAERDEIVSRVMTAGGLKFTKVYMMKAYGFDEEDIEDAPKPAAPLPPAVSQAQAGPEQKAEPEPDDQDGDEPAPEEKPAFSEQGQKALESYVANVAPKRWNAIVEPILKPVEDLIQSGMAYPEMMAALTSQFPGMDSTELEEMLARCWFASTAAGVVAANSDKGVA